MINKIKKEVQPKNSVNGIIGIKLVTNETVAQVMKAIKKDIEYYKPYRFIIRGNIIEIGLASNATPIAYYFTSETDIMDDVVTALEELCDGKDVRIRRI